MRFDALYLRNVVDSIEQRIKATRLDLSGLTVFTEAATGAYCVTPVIAAMAGAKEVAAFTRDSRFGKIDDVVRDTNCLIRSTGRALPVSILREMTGDEYSRYDIVTNSGHLRPITREHIMMMRPGAVIPLMYESWELRRTDVDLAACRERGIRYAGTNEHHRMLQVFDFLGPLVIKALHQCFVPVLGSRVAVISNNAFAEPVTQCLVQNRAEVFCVGPENCFAGTGVSRLYGELPGAELDQRIDACVIATTPSIAGGEQYTRDVVTEFVMKTRPATCIHVWGDIDHQALRQAEVLMVPAEPVSDGHQGLVMSGAGIEPVIRLIVGGFKVAEVLARNADGEFDLGFCQIDI
ncbi:MAG: hypothetical protein C0402_06680 [Thermodesulfovibrio sp.]|nr:hypothetical protein [Thermodesulfovibrio sp.]